MTDNNNMSRAERNKQKKKNKRKKKSGAGLWVKRIFLSLLFLFVLGVVSGGSLFVYYASSAPELTDEDLLGSYSSDLVDANGEVFYTLGGQQRDFARADEYPEVMKNAMMAIEDQRFESHFGIDPIGISRAAWGFLTNQGQIVGGGSTITQQLIKNSVFSTSEEDQTLERKAQEAWLAVQLERQLSKEEILSLYMNRIHMGGNVSGVSTAAEEYYGKHVSELELHEAALFAGMAQAPNRYNPYTNPENAETRRNVVLNVMEDIGDITAEEAEAARAVPIQEGLIELSDQDQNALVFDGYLTAVLDEVYEKTDFNPYTAGLRIETNLDMEAQEHMYNVLNSDEFVSYPDEELQAAVSLVDAETGQIRALGGGRNQEGQLSTNRATDLDRNVGSTIKPLSTYGPAIEYETFSTYHQIDDSEYTLDGWSPTNYDNNYLGWMSLRTALADSRNVPTAKIFNEDLNMENVGEFLGNIGIDVNELNSDGGGPYPQNAFNGRMTPLQLAGAYATFANGGNYTEPYTVSRIVTQDGQEIDLTPETNQEAISDYTAYMITDVLKDVVSANQDLVGIPGVNQAGKTGTTNYTAEARQENNIPSGGVPDSWYVGYTRNYSLSVWAGYDRQNEGWLSNNDGTRQIPRHIYQEIMSQVSEGLDNSDWTRPSSVSEVAVEDGSNPAALPGPNTPSGSIVTELFVQGTEPTDRSVTFGEELSTPSGLSAEYDEETDELAITWDEYTLENEDESVAYALTVGEQSTTVDGTEFSVSEPPEGDVTITLAVQAYGNTGPEASTSITIPPREPEEEEPEEPDEEEEPPEEEPDQNEEEENPDSNEENNPDEENGGNENEEENPPEENETPPDEGEEETPPEEEENPDDSQEGDESA